MPQEILKMSNNVIQIQWKGPFSLSTTVDFSDESVDYGIYQVYGSHPVYGTNTLLYIGKACDQTFSKRITQHNWEAWEFGRGSIQIHIGRLVGNKTPHRKEWNKQIDLVEALLIVAHSPALNKEYAGRSLPDETDKAVSNLHVINWGEYRSLLPEVSGLRWSDELDDPSDFAYYGNHKLGKFLNSK